jgi:hypothetical protein
MIDSYIRRGEPGVRSIGCLTWQCIDTLMGEDKMSLYSSTIPSTCFCCTKRLCVEVMDVAETFYLLRARITKKTNFSVYEMALLHCLAEIKEIVVDNATSGILYNCLPKVIITLRGLNS